MLLQELRTLTQQTFTFLKSKIGTLERGVKYIHSLKQRQKSDVTDIILMYFMLTWDIFLVLF